MRTKERLLSNIRVRWFLDQSENDLGGKKSAQWWSENICRGRAHSGMVEDLFIVAQEVLEEIDE